MVTSAWDSSALVENPKVPLLVPRYMPQHPPASIQLAILGTVVGARPHLGQSRFRNKEVRP